MDQLAGKTVFFSGASGAGGGIGGGMAQAFAEKGANIVLADINLAFVEEEAAKLPDGANVLPVELDVNEAYVITHPEHRDHVSQRFSDILAAFGEPAQSGYKMAQSGQNRTGPALV
jgi:NAD(P)-dependent dehydrogenase (short-subunit alcohol dehydrogenase family)